MAGTPKQEEELWALTAPVQLGEHVVSQPEETTTPDGKLSVVKGTYSDGETKFVLLLQRATDDLDSLPDVETLMTDNGVSGATVVGESSCGVAADNDVPLCLQVHDNTAILIAGLSGQSYEQLNELVNTMYATLRTS